jgi:hypothetical protein
MLFGVIQVNKDGSNPVLLAAFLMRSDAKVFMKNNIISELTILHIVEAYTWEQWSGVREKMLTTYDES